jgi:hypothetical protein
VFAKLQRSGDSSQVQRIRRAAALETRPEPIVVVGNSYPAGHTHPLHRRNQLLYASTGVMVVGTAQGTWVVPRQRAIRIPARIGHEIRMIRDVCTGSVYLEDGVIAKAPDRSPVFGVSPLLSRLLMEASIFRSPTKPTTGPITSCSLCCSSYDPLFNCLCAFLYLATRDWHRSTGGSWRSQTRGTPSTIGRSPYT